MEKMKATLQSNWWRTDTVIKVMGECKPSIIVQDLMSALALKFYASNCVEWLVNIQGQPDQDGQEASKVMVKPLDDLQKYFSKQFCKLINRVGRKCNNKIQVKCFKNLTPVQPKVKRVPKTLQFRVDKITIILGHIEKLEKAAWWSYSVRVKKTK